MGEQKQEHLLYDDHYLTVELDLTDSEREKPSVCFNYDYGGDVIWIDLEDLVAICEKATTIVNNFLKEGRD